MRKLDLIQYKRALDFSYNFYRFRYRKGIKFPYFNYLLSVSNLIIENNGTTDEAIAALIHDYFELEDITKKSNLFHILHNLNLRKQLQVLFFVIFLHD